MGVVLSVVVILFAALFTLVFVLNNVIQTARGSVQIGFVDTLLAFLTALLPLTALLLDPTLPDAGQTLLIVGAVVVLLSLPILALELRRQGRKLRQSRGILGIGVGLLLLIASFSVPLTSAYLTPNPESTAEPSDAVRADSDLQAEPSATLPIFLTNTPVPTATPSRTPRPTESPTPTHRPFGRPTAAATATFAATDCTARITANLRLRSTPDINAETLLTIPFDVIVPVFARTADSSWWLVQYADVSGWASGEFMEFNLECGDDTPVVN